MTGTTDTGVLAVGTGGGDGSSPGVRTDATGAAAPPLPRSSEEHDAHFMARAVANADAVRGSTAPNPWVGAVVVSDEGELFDGATQPQRGPHAEVEAVQAADSRARGATLYTTLEPCSHQGHNPPCVEAIVAAGVRRVVLGMSDPDPLVNGRGTAMLRAAGIEVTTGCAEATVRRQLAPYVKHRTTGRPWVVLKLAASLDGRTAAPDSSSKWITGPDARRDAHRLRARCDAVLVGAGTARADDPALTVRGVRGSDPQRIVLGRAPADAKIHPCWELSGELGDVLDELGGRGVIDLLVEGGAQVAAALHNGGFVDEYIVYLGPVLFGGSDGHPVFEGPGAPTIDDVWRGHVDDVAKIGSDIRVRMLRET